MTADAICTIIWETINDFLIKNRILRILWKWVRHDRYEVKELEELVTIRRELHQTPN